MNNKDATYKLNRIAERIKEGNYSDALFLDEDDATACELGATAIQKIDVMKLHLNSLYGKMVSNLTDDEEKFVRKCFKHENDNHEKNCTITIAQVMGEQVSINTYKLDDYRVATAICNILDNVRYTERHHNNYNLSSDYTYTDTDSIKENTTHD